MGQHNMRRKLSACLVAQVTVLGLALSAMPALGASAAGGSSPVAAQDPAAGSTARDRATAALEQALALFSGDKAADRNGGVRSSGSGADASLVMRDLVLAKDDLSPAQRKVAQSILARPTDGSNDQYGDGYTVPSVKKCKGNFCVHWVTSTTDAVPSQDWANAMLNLMNKVWKKEVKKLGYRHPVSDRGRGGNNKFDVYLANIGDAALYGYCAPERNKPGFEWVYDGYCVLDNDMAEFPLDPMDSAKVTAAHEFFHAIQFGYDVGEDPWLLEATATWMEERIFDDINDNRQYLPAGQVQDSLTPLDYFISGGSNSYGNWAFFEFLSKRYGNGIVQKIWNKASAYTGAPDFYSTQAITNVLKSKGGFRHNYAQFASANVLPAKFYPEGANWPPTDLEDVYTLSRDDRRTGKHGIRLLHMTSDSWRVTNDDTLRNRKWYLKVKIDGPASYRMPAAYVLVSKKHGFDKRFVKLNGKGNGQVIVPFSSRKVKAVYVSLVNASTRFKCNKKYFFSCSGLPVDDGRSFRGQPYKFSASVIKRR
jgi:hypothetical protein